MFQIKPNSIQELKQFEHKSKRAVKIHAPLVGNENLENFILGWLLIVVVYSVILTKLGSDF